MIMKLNQVIKLELKNIKNLWKIKNKLIKLLRLLKNIKLVKKEINKFKIIILKTF